MTGPSPAVAAVRAAVRTALHDLPPDALVLVACSGGPDSLALAAATAVVAPRLHLRAGAVVVDHALQPGSAQVAATAARTCRTLGLTPVDVRPAPFGRSAVPTTRTSGPEADARAARYAALEQHAEATGAAVVLLGHTLDDQAETVLLGLARGSGARSLAGMPARRGRLRRPLLELPRGLVHASLPAGSEPWTDPTNADPALTRSRVRGVVLPVLETELGPGVAQALSRTAAMLAEDADALDGLAAAVPVDDEDGVVRVAVAALEPLPAAVRRRVLLAAARRAGSPPTDLTRAHVLAVDALVTAWHGQGPLHLPGRVEVSRSCGTLVLARAAPPEPDQT